MEKKNEAGERSEESLSDLRAGIHGEVTSGGLLGERNRDPLAIKDKEVMVAPGSKLPTGQATRE